MNPKLPSFLSVLLFLPLDLTAVPHHNWCLKDTAKMSVSGSQLVSQATNNLLAIHARFHQDGGIYACVSLRLLLEASPAGRGPDGRVPLGVPVEEKAFP